MSEKKNTSIQDLEDRLAKRQFVYRDDDFAERVSNYLRSDQGIRNHEALTERQYTLNEAGVSTRVVNYWESKGVTEDPRDGGTGWRRFSLLDMVWLHAVERLRSFGMSMEHLRRVRESLLDLGSLNGTEGPPMTLFELYVTHALLRNVAYLLVFADGEVELAVERELQGATHMAGLADHIRIRLNDIVQEILPHADLRPKLEMPVNLTDEQLHVLVALRTGDYDSVSIKLNDGKIDRIEAREDISERRIIDILKEADFQDVTIKRRDGKEVHVSRTTINKL
jgi:DNA-binding transcriptional MerR regulator